MSTSHWKRVTVQSPCPVCRGPDWCCVSADGTVAKCMRVADGCFRSKEDRNGAPYHLHRLADGPRAGGPARPPPSPREGRADADTLNAVYSALLARLTLNAAHREALRRRGLADEAIDRGAYRTMPARGRTRVVRELRDRFGDG